VPAHLLVGWVARCWALRNQAPRDWIVSRVLVFLWLFGCWIVDASIFVAVLLRVPFSFSLWGVGLGCPVFVVFVCVATSYEGRMVDALASRADEGRRSLR
jgi:hypothetical protein